ncbi:sodium:proton antiporter, partial [Escherichia coli]|nr:sodium:proton antiporter [Escherichia coli]
MSLLHIAVILPLIFALIIPILYRFFKRIHLGWFVLPVPIVIFIYMLTLIKTTMSGNTVMKTLNWMP